MKKLIVIAAALLVAGGIAAVTANMLSAITPGASARTVRTIGGESFVPNGRIAANMRFLPGDIRIRSGGKLTFRQQDTTQDHHTLTIVDAADIPNNINDVFNCGAPGTVCDEVFTALGNPGPNGPPPPPVYNAPGSMPGLDARLDTLVVGPGESVSATVSAPAGTTLYYMCAIHAWMQGRIIVS